MSVSVMQGSKKMCNTGGEFIPMTSSVASVNSNGAEEIEAFNIKRTSS
jgi:hypothetical protein